MTYALIDDNFPNNPKVERTSIYAKYLYVCGLCYCTRNLTDGEITANALRKVLIEAGAKPKHAIELMHDGLWDRTPAGFLVHDWGDVNHSAEIVKARRKEVGEKRREAGRKGAKARWEDGKTMAKPMAKPDGKTMANENGPLHSSPYRRSLPSAGSAGTTRTSFVCPVATCRVSKKTERKLLEHLADVHGDEAALARVHALEEQKP